MYFPVGWPKAVNLSLPGTNTTINHICCDAVKILVAAVGDIFLGIFYANPLIPIVFHQRNVEAVVQSGKNKFIVWKPDSRQLAILTTHGVLILYRLDFELNGNNGILTQIDSPLSNLKRDSAELFIKENIPRLSLHELRTVELRHASISTICCISLSDLLIANEQCQLIRIKWTDLESHCEPSEPDISSNSSSSNSSISAADNGASRTAINLRQLPFYVNQNCHLKSSPAIGDHAYLIALEYSPFIGGCAVIFSDKRAAFLIATQLRFETQNMHGFWVPDVEDATVCSVNHKFRLLAYGRQNSDVAVYSIEDTTGGLEYSHNLTLHATVLPGSLGGVSELKWSPDGCVLIVAWQNGGISLWSTFGALLMSSFSWDFGLHMEMTHKCPLQVCRLEWCTEGYQLFMTCKRALEGKTPKPVSASNVLQLNFVKSTLTMNPCMASHPYILLQGEDTLYLNQGDNLEKIYFGKFMFPNNCSSNGGTSETPATNDDNADVSLELKKASNISSILSESKYWSVLQLPQTYGATNWPIRYSAIDAAGLHLAVAGRTGLAHYSILTKKWKLFGNESQEKDFVVSGGLLWWKGFIVLGCYSLLDRTDEIRCYPEECKLDNQFGNKIQVRAPVISLNMFQDQLIALTADGVVSLFVLRKRNAYTLSVECAYELDVKSICIHPACIVSLTVTNLKIDMTAKTMGGATSSQDDLSVSETIIVNVCGRILMIQRDSRNAVINSLMASCLASCVECFWLSNTIETSPMRNCLWLYSGVHGMRVWLPILPPQTEPTARGDAPRRLHSFMSKRIMLSFPLKLYPLAILFDNVIVLGVENETTLYANEPYAHFALPFCLLERKSQVYLHKILRQLIKRNLGYSAWEIARSCRALPYFPHSLELLLHEVLEEEATSKEPIPDALLPSILDFIREFPLYLQTIVQCARKTEIALWPYLFAAAGKPKDLFQQCLQAEQLETAASYLIILQNLEPSIVSKQYATQLLDIALQQRKWELAKDLIRFLKAIDPNEIDSPRSSMVVNVKIAPTPTQTQVNQNPEVFNLILGPIARERSFSTTVVVGAAVAPPPNPGKEKKDKAPSTLGGTSIGSTAVSAAAELGGGSQHTASIKRRTERNNSLKEKKETFCIDSILQRHARTLLQQYKLLDLGYMSAYLDFHMVTWLSQEAALSARLDDFVLALTCLHEELQLAPALTAASDAEAHTPVDYAQLQRHFQMDTNFHMPHTSSQTSESGYFSLALMDTPTSITNGNGSAQQQQIGAIKEHEEMHYATMPPIAAATPVEYAKSYAKSRSNSQISMDTTRYRRAFSLHDDVSSTLTLGLDSLTTSAEFTQKILPDKLSIKIRYLLQLFTEANCADYALVLSILLQDAASIGRLINVVIRSESVVACKRMEAALKRLTQWSFDRECIYRPFMITLQPHIYLLDQYIMSFASNNNNSNDANMNASLKADAAGCVDSLGADDVDTMGQLTNMLQAKHISNTQSLHHRGSYEPATTQLTRPSLEKGNHQTMSAEHHLKHQPKQPHRRAPNASEQLKIKRNDGASSNNCKVM